MFSIFGGLLVGIGGGWLAGRLHLKATQLKAANQFLNLPTGTLENELNASTETLIQAGAEHLASKLTTVPSSAPPRL